MLAVEEGHLQVLARFSAEPQSEERLARGDVTQCLPWGPGSPFQNAQRPSNDPIVPDPESLF
jgi:hypothetical protein